MHVGDALVVAFEKAQQHVGEEVARRLVEPPHDAEIDRHQGAVPRAAARDEHVAGMQVGMEEAVAEGLVEERPGARSEEHTSELQSLMRTSYAVFCLKNKKTHNTRH